MATIGVRINSTSFIVDDSSPNIIFSDDWFPQGSGYGPGRAVPASIVGSSVDPDYNQTFHLTSTYGATALFSFTGTAIEVIGSVGPESWGGSPTSRYTLDTMPTVDYSATPTESYQTNVSFFKSPSLENGPHTLLVTKEPCQSQNLNQSCKLLLDYIIWTRLDASQTTSVEMLSTGTTNPTSTAETVASSHSKVSASAIAGPVVGAVVLLALIGLLLSWYTRKRRRSNGGALHGIFDEDLDSPTAVNMSENRQTDQLLSQHAIAPYPLNPQNSLLSPTSLSGTAYLDSPRESLQGSSSHATSSSLVLGTSIPSQAPIEPKPPSGKVRNSRQPVEAPVYEDAPPAYSPAPPS